MKEKKKRPRKVKNPLPSLIARARAEMREKLDKEEEDFGTFCWGFKKGFMRAFELMEELSIEDNEK